MKKKLNPTITGRSHCGVTLAIERQGVSARGVDHTMRTRVSCVFGSILVEAREPNFNALSSGRFQSSSIGIASRQLLLMNSDPAYRSRFLCRRSIRSCLRTCGHKLTASLCASKLVLNRLATSLSSAAGRPRCVSRSSTRSTPPSHATTTHARNSIHTYAMAAAAKLADKIQQDAQCQSNERHSGCADAETIVGVNGRCA
jgi:hypothetical protein